MVTIHERCLGLTKDVCYFIYFNFTSDCIFLIEYYFSINENFNFYIFLVCRPVVANCRTRE